MPVSRSSMNQLLCHRKMPWSGSMSVSNHSPPFSNGEKIENPRFFRTDEKALAKAQRKLSKTEKETPERKKARKVVARIHERIANRRLDFAHQTSRQMVVRFGTIVFEDLNIKNMQKNHHWQKHCRCCLESVHHGHREQSGRGWFSRDPGESQEYITAVFQVWYDRQKDAF